MSTHSGGALTFESGTDGSAGSSAGANVSVKDLFSLFCCPPWPSSIVSKLAFMPPDPSYRILTNETGSEHTLQLITGKSEWPHGASDFRNLQVLFAHSSRGNKIACLWVKARRDPRFTILFSHGNAVDLGQMCSFYYGLAYRLGCNIFSYDYSGYGCSSGRPTEKNLYADIAAAYDTLTGATHCGVAKERVIIYGQSIGTVPSIDLASKCGRELAAVVLHSPLMSGMRVAFPATQRTWCCDAFPRYAMTC